MLEKKPEEVIRLAVRRMLPKGSLGNHLLKRLKIYAGPDHPHAAQCPGGNAAARERRARTTGTLGEVMVEDGSRMWRRAGARRRWLACGCIAAPAWSRSIRGRSRSSSRSSAIAPSVLAPLKATKTLGKFDVVADVFGGGLSGQAEAIMLGVARALRRISSDTDAALRESGLLTRDSRMKERKKYGRKAARRSFQFSKR